MFSLKSVQLHPKSFDSMVSLTQDIIHDKIKA